MLSEPIPEWVLTHRRAIGERVRQARLWANLTQEKLAELVGVDRSTVIRIEAGTSSARIDHLLLIAHAVGVALADLVRE